MWTDVFNDPDLLQFRYTMIVSPTQHQELQELTVRTTSLNGKVFSASLPFSWLIFTQIEDILKKTITVREFDGWFHSFCCNIYVKWKKPLVTSASLLRLHYNFMFSWPDWLPNVFTLVFERSVLSFINKCSISNRRTQYTWQNSE